MKCAGPLQEYPFNLSEYILVVFDRMASFDSACLALHLSIQIYGDLQSAILYGLKSR